MTIYVAANLMYGILIGCLDTEILHLFNQTPIDWYTKKLATMEDATYGSVFVAAKTCVKQIIDLYKVLCYLGAPICTKSYVLEDIKSVVNSDSTSHTKLHKLHTALSFHCVHKEVAAKIKDFYFIEEKNYLADIPSKQ